MAHHSMRKLQLGVDQPIISFVDTQLNECKQHCLQHSRCVWLAHITNECQLFKNMPAVQISFVEVEEIFEKSDSGCTGQYTPI